MLTSVLAFDLRVYDPGAPLFGVRDVPEDATSAVSVVIGPSDAGFPAAYTHPDNANNDGTSNIGRGGLQSTSFPFAGQGAYVDLGYCDAFNLNAPTFFSGSAAAPWFFARRALNNVFGEPMAPGYAVYDTWSFHYENNGVNEDQDGLETVVINQKPYQVPRRDFNNQFPPQIDEGTDGFDSPDTALTMNPNPNLAQEPPGEFTFADTVVGGPDDAGERETSPPYDKPLRGAQVLIRVYEPDSRAIRQVRVNQHFMQE
jgi:hypothetical protein